MNYNSVNEILSAGITNMQVLRNNTKQDNDTDTITGVSWFTYNGTVVNNIYASGNSWIGFGSASDEHLKVNCRDGALYSLYREEGTLYDYFKFLKIRWKGYSKYNRTDTYYSIEYDVILWDTGDISLHMVKIPTSYNSGDYELNANTTYYYSVNSSNLDVTFKKSGSSFEVVDSIIELKRPTIKRYLIHSDSNYYIINNNTLEQIEVSDLTSDVFLNMGMNEISSTFISLISNLTNPEILYWNDNGELLEKGLTILGTPSLPQIVYCDNQDISNYPGIKSIEANATDDVLFNISFDNEQTWKYFKDGSWVICTSDTEGMNKDTMNSISVADWTNITTSTSYRIRCILFNKDSAVKLYPKYLE